MVKSLLIFFAACLIIGVIIHYKTFFIILAVLAVTGYFVSKHSKKAKNKATPDFTAIESPKTTKSKPDKVQVQYECYSNTVNTTPLPDCKRVKIRATGMKFRMDNLMKLAIEDPYYNTSKKQIIEDCLMNQRHFQYCFPSQNVYLVPEPENPYDPNAVKVVIKDQHIAYIKASDCEKILKLIHSKRIRRVQAEISGGKYKIVLGPDDMFADPSEFRLVRDEAPFSVILHLDIYAPKKASNPDTK